MSVVRNVDVVEKVESYKALAVCTGHLPQDDMGMLKDSRSNMIMERDTGFFVKLYDDLECNLKEFFLMSDEFNKIISFAFDNGYRLIEFDRDVDLYPDWKSFDW